MSKRKIVCMSIVVLLLGSTVTFGAGVYACATADSSDPGTNVDSDVDTYSIWAPGTGNYDWEYDLTTAASAALYGTGSGLAKGAAQSSVSGVCPSDVIASTAQRSTPGTTTDPAFASSDGNADMDTSDRLLFAFTAYGEATWTSGSCTVEGIGAASGDGRIW